MTLRFLMTVLIVALPVTGVWAKDGFDSWLQDVRTEARAQGISENTISAALSNIQPRSRIIELDRKQPEGRLTFAQYYKNVVNAERIQKGRALYKQHKSLLDQISKQYGVQPQYIVALWGIETSYGNNTGGFNVVEALATLAWDGRRAEFFRSELMNALKFWIRAIYHLPP